MGGGQENVLGAKFPLHVAPPFHSRPTLKSNFKIVNYYKPTYHSIFALSVLIKIHAELNLPLYYNDRIQTLYCFQI